MNPPFGTVRGMVPGETMSAGRATRSEHIFMELAVRALKPGGQAVLIVPSQGVYRPPFHNRRPKKLAVWFEERARVVDRDLHLPGEFRFTHINVEALVLERYDYDVPVVDAVESVAEVPVIEAEPEPPVPEALPETPSAPVLPILMPAPRPAYALDTALALIGQVVTWQTGHGKVVNVSSNGHTLFVETTRMGGKSDSQAIRITDVQI